MLVPIGAWRWPPSRACRKLRDKLSTASFLLSDKKALVDRLTRNGQNAAEANILLSQLQGLRTLHVEARDRLLQQLAAQRPNGPGRPDLHEGR